MFKYFEERGAYCIDENTYLYNSLRMFFPYFALLTFKQIFQHFYKTRSKTIVCGWREEVVNCEQIQLHDFDFSNF